MHEATLGIIEPSAKDDPVLRGVSDVFGTTDVYEAYPPADAKILLRGEVLKGMTPTSPPADHKKKRSTDKKEQGVNDPMMAVAWTRVYKNEAGHENRILCTTMGAATDLENEGLRRMIVNGVYCGLGMDVPPKADVIFAFYGFNESFKGQASLEKFKADLDKFLKDTKKRKYSDKGPPRVVLFSPIANEKLPDGNHFDPAANNADIQLYSNAMAEVAKANGVLFVDLFTPSQDLYAQAARQGKPLTINGLYLSEEGDRQLAPVAFRGIFGETAPEGDFDKLRMAVNEKNTQWHRRYRTMDGYNIYGGRSAEAYQPGRGQDITDRNAPPPYVSNYRIMQEEMTQRDVLTANRDQH